MSNHRFFKLFIPVAAACILFCSACVGEVTDTASARENEVSAPQAESDNASGISDAQRLEISAEEIDLSALDIPAYSGEPSVIVNGNEPFFEESDCTTEVFEIYSDLDSLGRCRTAYANICQELMPTEKRGDISEIHPTGWHSSRYDFVDGESLYNRCHLIAHELAGEDANEKNLITGTRYFNVDGMQSFENMTADYVKETGNHVLYRVTPIFTGDNLVADGALMEAFSVEDDGEGICFCVYCYNVQPGVEIDYATGDNWLAEDTENQKSAGEDASDDSEASESEGEKTYILNTNSMKFHLPDCDGVADISENNRQEYTGNREDLIEQGYSPCGSCNP